MLFRMYRGLYLRLRHGSVATAWMRMITCDFTTWMPVTDVLAGIYRSGGLPRTETMAQLSVRVHSPHATMMSVPASLTYCLQKKLAYWQQESNLTAFEFHGHLLCFASHVVSARNRSHCSHIGRITSRLIICTNQ